MSNHGNYLGPTCLNCDEEIYLTAADGHWTHKWTENKECNRMHYRTVAQPVVYKGEPRHGTDRH